MNKIFNTIWVTGAGGLIGSYFVRSLTKLLPAAKVIPVGRARCDLGDTHAVKHAFQQDKPDLVIHCAALTRIPECEADPGAARKLNVEATRVLADLAEDRVLLFMSTDQIFDGQQPPYTEASPVNPFSVYGETKVLAEQAVLTNPNHIVIRTSLNGGTSPTGDRGVEEQMRLAWKAGRELCLFTDEFRCPVHARDTTLAACELALRGCTGVFNLAGPERISRWELGVLVARRWPELNPRICPGSLKDFKGPKRAPDLTMDSSKAISILGRPIPGFPEWLRTTPKEEL